MNSLLSIFVGLCLLLISVEASGQKILHLTYKPTSWMLIDTSWSYDQWDAYDHSVEIAGFDSLEVFISPKYYASISFRKEYRLHTVYNRKTRILRRHLKYYKKETFTEDSVMYYLYKDKHLRKKAYHLKDSLSIQYTQVQKSIHGKKCQLITLPTYGWFSSQRDSLWVAYYKDIPMMNQVVWWMPGVPFEFIVNDGLLSVRVESSITPVPDLPFDVFTIDPGMNDLRQLQSHLSLDNFVEDFRSSMP